ncbi:hypothetical protein B0H13DRAFT_2473793 [Mycena leptocephala]|nr:hypothetical protein B0H13DRAFT_2473793 [Mycena leptocephala]
MVPKTTSASSDASAPSRSNEIRLTQSKYSLANAFIPTQSHFVPPIERIDPRDQASSFASSRGFVSHPIPEIDSPSPAPPSLTLPSSTTNHPSLPKLVTDKVSKLETQSATITDEVDNHARTLKLLQQDYHELRDRVNELEILNENLTTERDELAHQVDGMEDTISDLSGMVTAHQVALEKFGTLFEEMGGSDDVTSALRSKKAQKALKGPRDNVLNTSIRQVFYRAMGHPTNVEPEKLAPVDAGGCWIDDPETEDDHLLRPDFSASWTENSVWHDPMVTFARTHLPSVCPSLSNHDIEKITDATIKSQLQTVFKGVTSKYRKWAKSKGKAPVTIAHSDLPNVKNRRARRKERKLEERARSTDESDDDDVLDPDTDSGNEVDVATTKKPWVSRPPTYRGQTLESGVNELDRLVAQDRKEREKAKKTVGRNRRRGEPKDVPLPRLTGPNSKRISRAAICPKWLAANKEENDMPSRIQEES